jgi:hypothetical protein
MAGADEPNAVRLIQFLRVNGSDLAHAEQGQVLDQWAAEATITDDRHRGTAHLARRAKSNSGNSKTKRVADHRHGTQAHGGRRNNGA